MIKLFFGNDTFRSRLALERYLSEAKDRVTELGEDAWETLGRQEGLFGTRGVFVIRRALQNFPGDAGKRLKALRDDQETSYFFWEAGDILPHVKKLFRKDEQEEYRALKPKEALGWLTELGAEAGIQWGRVTRERLVEWFGADTARLWNEFQKLVLFLHPEKEIPLAAIERLALEPVSSSVFELVETALGRNRGRAAELLLRERAAGSDEFQLLGLFAGELRLALLLNGALRASSVRFANLAERFDVHPFRIKKALAVEKRFSSDDLVRAFTRCFQVDLQMKQGRLEPAAALEQLILGI